jgi:hypothetical protein
MRHYWSHEDPPLTRVLLIESGSRHLIELGLRHSRALWGDDVKVDLVTCYAGLPAGYGPETTVYRVSEYGGPDGHKRLVRELRAQNYSFAGMICSAEPIMSRWKWLIAVRLPAKFFILNENGDYFWVQRANWPTIRHFALLRAGLSGAGALKTMARLLLFPFSVLFLMLYAAFVHARRWLRLKLTSPVT